MEKQVIISKAKSVMATFKSPIMLAFCLGLITMTLIGSDVCLAADKLPWEGPLDTLEASLTGPVATAAAIITCCVCGVMVAMGEGGQFGRLAIKIVMGLSMALFASNFITIIRNS